MPVGNIFFSWQAHQVLCRVFNAADRGWGGLSIPAHNFPVFCFSSFDVMSYFDVPMELRCFCLPDEQNTLMLCSDHSHQAYWLSSNHCLHGIGKISSLLLFPCAWFPQEVWTAYGLLSTWLLAIDFSRLGWLSYTCSYLSLSSLPLNCSPSFHFVPKGFEMSHI